MRPTGSLICTGTCVGRRLTVGRSSVQSARTVLSADLGHRRAIKPMAGIRALQPVADRAAYGRKCPKQSLVAGDHHGEKSLIAVTA